MRVKSRALQFGKGWRNEDRQGSHKSSAAQGSDRHMGLHGFAEDEMTYFVSLVAYGVYRGMIKLALFPFRVMLERRAGNQPNQTNSSPIWIIRFRMAESNWLSTKESSLSEDSQWLDPI